MSTQKYDFATVEVWQNNELVTGITIDNPYDSQTYRHLIRSLPAGKYEVKVEAANTPGEPGYGTGVKKFKVPVDTSSGSTSDIEKEIEIYLREGIESLRFKVLNYDDNTPIPHADIDIFKFAGILGTADGSNAGEFEVPWLPIGRNKAVIIPDNTNTWQTVAQPVSIISGQSADVDVYLFPPIDLRINFKDGTQSLTNVELQLFTTQEATTLSNPFWEEVPYTIDGSGRIKVEKASNGTYEYKVRHPDIEDIVEGTFVIHYNETSGGLLEKTLNIGTNTVTWNFSYNNLSIGINSPSLTNGAYTTNVGTEVEIRASYLGSIAKDSTYEIVARERDSSGAILASTTITTAGTVASLKPTLIANNSRTIWVGIEITSDSQAAKQ